MTEPAGQLRIWLVDPINYSGMAYYDAGLAGGLARAGADVTLLGSDKPLVRPAEGSGVRFVPVFAGTGPGRPRWLRGLAYVASSWRLTRSLRRSTPDWVLWNYVEQPTLDRLVIGRARAREARVGFVAHEVEPWGYDEKRRGDYRWLIEEASDAVLVHGKANEEAVHAVWNVPRARVITIEHGDYREWVDPSVDQGAARQRLELPVDAPIALFFGTLRATKGLLTLLQAWPAVHEALPEAILLVAGRPDRGADLSMIESAPEGVRIRVGEFSPAEANDYYAACDVVTIPYDRVSTSGVLRFAYSAARPVLASDVGELHTHVANGETGWLIKPGDAEAAASALVTALSDRDRALELGRTGNAYATGAFDWEVIGGRLLDRLATLGTGAGV